MQLLILCVLSADASSKSACGEVIGATINSVAVCKQVYSCHTFGQHWNSKLLKTKMLTNETRMKRSMWSKKLPKLGIEEVMNILLAKQGKSQDLWVCFDKLIITLGGFFYKLRSPTTYKREAEPRIHSQEQKKSQEELLQLQKSYLQLHWFLESLRSKSW